MRCMELKMTNIVRIEPHGKVSDLWRVWFQIVGRTTEFKIYVHADDALGAYTQAVQYTKKQGN